LCTGRTLPLYLEGADFKHQTGKQISVIFCGFSGRYHKIDPNYIFSNNLLINYHAMNCAIYPPYGGWGSVVVRALRY
jgi:hypothetical protein